MGELAHAFEDDIGADELRRLLEELPGEDLRPNRDDLVTIDAVAEATGCDPLLVRDLLARLRAEDEELRLARSVRELEEPLYSVERPGHATPDPLQRHFREDWRMKNRPAIRPPIRRWCRAELPQADFWSRFAATTIVVAVALGLVAVMVFGIAQAFGR